MKVLIYGLNYAPELSGTGKYTAEMSQLLTARGHQVRVVCAPPYYPEWRIAPGFSAWRYRHDTLQGVRVWRAPLWVPAFPGGIKRMLHLASFALSSLPLLMRQLFWRPDVVLTIAPTMLCAPAALTLARCTRAKAWLHIQDYEIDAAFDLGLLKSPRVSRFAHWLERGLLSRFDVVSSISDRMVERAISKGVDKAQTVCVPNWVDLHAIYPLTQPSIYRSLLGIPKDHTVVLYSGNMGAKQGIETLAAAAAALAERTDISFVFCGAGVAKADLAARCAGLSNCHMLPLQPVALLNELLNVADIHVLPQRGDVADLVMPSKLTGMLASGRAVIAMAQPGTSLYEVTSDTGVAVPPDDVDALVAAIAALSADEARRAILGRAARRYAEQRLSPAMAIGVLDARLSVLVHGEAAVRPADADANGARRTPGEATKAQVAQSATE
ncbi:glycosyltransferase WbuB [Paraburkholderia sp.]|uniref:glycosyltransferase WbuB n=1 Tax=Paraburkholderia sp. TaxID=1926495 RepID=UPI002387AFCD|nr:glycosyltransferase WbuB [Paraburkholderia sp.]MDE1183029.1 glycosyltransferase WbuB [Paraburkholderia sp.]